MDIQNGVGQVGTIGSDREKRGRIRLDVDKHTGGLEGLPSLPIYKSQHNKCC